MPELLRNTLTPSVAICTFSCYSYMIGMVIIANECLLLTKLFLISINDLCTEIFPVYLLPHVFFDAIFCDVTLWIEANFTSTAWPLQIEIEIY